MLSSQRLVESGKIFQDCEPQTLAFFRMKLESMNIFLMDSGGEIDSITGGGGNDRRVLGNNII